MAGNVRDSVKHLSRAEFASSLKKGQGRALLHVLHFGLDDVADLVLEACLEDQRYDHQIESSRASWLFRMFGNSTHYPTFSRSVIKRLKLESETWDVLQLCELAKEMAAHGDQKVRQALWERVRENARESSEDDWVGADEWVELEGAKGLLELARLYGQRLLLDPKDDVPHNYLYGDEKSLEFKEIVVQQAQKEPTIKAYWDYLEASGDLQPPNVRLTFNMEASKRRSREHIRQRLSLKGILRDAKKKLGRYPGNFAYFGNTMTAEEIQEVYVRLVNEADEAVCLRLLWIFRRTPMPDLNERVFRWAEGPDEELRRAAIAALSQKSDPQIHALARLKVRGGQLAGADSEALLLFLNNYSSEDASRIAQALWQLTPNADDAHDLAHSLIDVVKQNSDIELAPALQWVYENTSCTHCRYNAVRQLALFQRLDEATLYECEFDGEERIRTFAQEHKAG